MKELITGLAAPIAALAAVIVIIVVAFCIILKIQTAARRKKVESYGKESEQRVDALLKENFGEDFVMTGTFLPYLRSSEGKYTEIDHIVFTRGGIFVIEVKSHNGFIKCPNDRFWWQNYNDKKIRFYNPIWQNNTHVKIVQEILRNEGQYNLPIHSIVVFTSNKVTFSEKYDNLIGVGELVGYIKHRCRKNTISAQRLRRIIAIIKKHSSSSRKVAHKHKKALRQYK